MALNPDFTTSQSIGSPAVILFTDTSTGDDSNVVSRKIYLTKADGTTLVPEGTTTSYIVWSIDDDTLALDVLPQDYCLSIRVEWCATGGSVLYDKTTLCLFQLYQNTFLYNLIQFQASTPTIISDANYWGNVFQLESYIDNAVQAVSIGGDIAAAQNACDKGMYLVNHSNLYF